MSDHLIAYTAEVICSALHQNGWQLLGEPNGSRGSTWWRHGQFKDQMVRVEVQRLWDDDSVMVVPEWLILMPDARFVKGYKQIRLTCNSTMTRSDTHKATAACVATLFELMVDVQTRTGQASPEWYVAHMGRPDST